MGKQLQVTRKIAGAGFRVRQQVVPRVFLLVRELSQQKTDDESECQGGRSEIDDQGRPCETRVGLCQPIPRSAIAQRPL